MSQTIPYGDPDLEMLYSFGHFLLPHLPKRPPDDGGLWYGPTDATLYRNDHGLCPVKTLSALRSRGARQCRQMPVLRQGPL